MCTAGGLGADPVPDNLGWGEATPAWSLSGGLSTGRVRYSLLQNLDAQVPWWGVALLKGHVGLVPRLLQPSPDADVLDDSEPQDPVGTACPGRLQVTAQDSPELTGRWGPAVVWRAQVKN